MANGIASFVAFAVLAAGLSACTTTEPRLIRTELGSLPASDAIGLERNEIGRRLGLSPVSEPRVQSAYMRDGVLVTEMFGPHMGYQHRCEGGRMPTLAFRRGERDWSFPPMVFHDDVLVEFKPSPRRNEDVSQPAMLVSGCERWTRSSKNASRDVAAILVFAPVLLPIGATMGAINALGSNDINKPLGDLVLGAAPPGGLEAYFADPPRHVRLLARSGGSAELGLHFVSPDTAEEAARTAAARVFIVDGVVSRLEGRNCVLTTTRTLRCSPGY